jgi:hypothetical protein
MSLLAFSVWPLPTPQMSSLNAVEPVKVKLRYTHHLSSSPMSSKALLRGGSAGVLYRVQNTYMTDADSNWDQNAIVVVPGLPGRLSTPDDDQLPLPASALVFVKVLRGAGYPIRIATEDSREVSHHAADEWLPVANFGLQVLAGGAGNVLAGILMLVFSAIPRRKRVVHIRWNVQGPDGSVHEFEFDGDGEAAIDSARAFERSLGYFDDAN